MDNAQKAIMIGVGLFITIIVISAVMVITGLAQDLLNQGQNKLGNLSTSLQNQLLNQYDQKPMSGSLVLSAIKSFYEEENMAVVLYNTTSSPSPIYVSTSKLSVDPSLDATGKSASKATVDDTAKLVDNDNHPDITTFSKVGDDNYIKPTAQYKSVLIQTNGGLTAGVAFVRYK